VSKIKNILKKSKDATNIVKQLKAAKMNIVKVKEKVSGDYKLLLKACKTFKEHNFNMIKF
jgi:hypothetical protein